MSEPTPRAPGTRPGDTPADDALAAMNDHLARFFQHADTLLHDWQAYGDKLRRSIDGEVGQIGDKVAHAVTEAGRNAASQLDSRVEQGVADSLASLRRELDSLARLANQTAARNQPAHRQGSSAALEPGRRTWTSPIFWALVAANLMLAVLLATTVRDCQTRSEHQQGAAISESASDPAGSVAPDPGGDTSATGTDGQKESLSGDGGAPAVSGDPDSAGDVDTAAQCETLASGYDAAAAEMLLGATLAAVCGERADAVENVLFERLGSPPDKPESSKATKKDATKKDATKKDATKRDATKKDAAKSPKKSSNTSSGKAGKARSKRSGSKTSSGKATSGDKASKSK